MPKEIVTYGDNGFSVIAALVLQIAGALYLGLAVLNWMAQANLIGGIYSRPVAIGNLTRFVVAGLAIFKVLFSSGQSLPLVLVVLGQLQPAALIC